VSRSKTSNPSKRKKMCWQDYQYFQDQNEDTVVKYTYIALMTLILVLVLCGNILAIFVTLKVNSIRSCSFMRLFTLCYTGNIVAAIPYLIGQILNSLHLIGYCRFMNHHVLFFGVCLKTTILLTNTLKRKQAVTLLQNKHCIKNKSLVLRYALPCIIASIIMAAVAWLLGKFARIQFLLILVILIAPVFVIIIAFNLMLTFSLHEHSLLSSSVLKSSRSAFHIKRARRMIITVTLFQTIILLFWAVIATLSSTIDYWELRVGLTWILSVIFGGMFLSEPLVLVMREKTAFVKSILGCCGLCKQDSRSKQAYFY